MLEGAEAIGFLLKVETKGSLCGAILRKLLCVSPKHWCCVRRVGNKYALLDSLIDEPLYM